MPDINLSKKAKVALELVYLPDLVNNFLIKIFRWLYSIN